MIDYHPHRVLTYDHQSRLFFFKQKTAYEIRLSLVGSANSSNSVRLVEVALESGAGAAHRVDTADEVREEWVAGATTVGLTSGASVPEILVRDVVARLGELGFGEVEEVRTATEGIMFSLPKNLRSDLKAAGEQPDRPHRARS